MFSGSRVGFAADVSVEASVQASGVLAAARRHRAAADAAEFAVLSDALAWAELHAGEPEEAHCVGRGAGAVFGDSLVALAGDGAPLVSEFCVAEFAAAVGMSTDAGRGLIGDALELAYRLPRTWARVEMGELAVWRARRIADQTTSLTIEAAAMVDAAAAPYAHKLGPAATLRLVEEAIARHMPQAAEQLAKDAADGRFVAIDHPQVSFTGTAVIRGELDHADALDLDTALQAGAAELKDLGSGLGLDARRAAALGALARGEAHLALNAAQDGTADDEPGPKPVAKPGARPGAKPARPRRQIVLYIHLSDQALASPGSRTGAGVARLEAPGTGAHGPLLTAAQVAGWCRVPDTQITVKPVIDLGEEIAVDSYEIPDRLREQTILRHRTCIFPWCTRPARTCDLDHTTPYQTGGQTNTNNLAPLCRAHHRLKTHGGWTYQPWDPDQPWAPDQPWVPEEGAQRPSRRASPPNHYLWRSPHGHTYHRGPDGTRQLTPPPVEPPGSPPG